MLLLVLLLNLVCVSALSISGVLRVPKDALDQRTRILVDGSVRAYMTRENTFEINNLEPGTHLVQVLCSSHEFDPVRLIVQQDYAVAYQFYTGSSWDKRGPKLSTDPLTLVPKQRLDFFIPRESFSVFSLLGNPMIIMMLFSMGMLYAMPKMMQNLDPEVLKEIQEQQKQVQAENPDLGSLMKNILSKK